MVLGSLYRLLINYDISYNLLQGMRNVLEVRTLAEIVLFCSRHCKKGKLEIISIQDKHPEETPCPAKPARPSP